MSEGAANAYVPHLALVAPEDGGTVFKRLVARLEAEAADIGVAERLLLWGFSIALLLTLVVR